MSSSAGARPASSDFALIAASYDRLRPADERWWEVFDLLVSAGDLAGRRTLDVGCGTGTLAVALAEGGAKVWGVDSSPEMLAEAQAKESRARFKEAPAEDLPFKDGWFERVVMRLSLHHLDRPRALREAWRVLAPGGRLVVGTFDPDQFADYWLTGYFPSIAPIDAARFPDQATLERDIGAAGFATPTTERLNQESRLSRAEALERIRGRYISTLRLMGEEEFDRGLAAAEAELPAEVDYCVKWLVVAAEKTPLDAVRPPG
jgi:ubiquinone/menaquinone biosynthesis C-methylase UbiE